MSLGNFSSISPAIESSISYSEASNHSNHEDRYSEDEQDVLIPKSFNDDVKISQSQYKSILAKKVTKSNKRVTIQLPNQNKKRTRTRLAVCMLIFSANLIAATVSVTLLAIFRSAIALYFHIIGFSLLAACLSIAIISGVSIIYFAKKYIAIKSSENSIYKN